MSDAPPPPDDVDRTVTYDADGVGQASTVAAPPAPRLPRAAVGAQVGRYVLARALGAGGMGLVFEARDPKLDRAVALKVVRPDIGDRASRARLVREARAMAQLEHANIVRVYDAGEEGDEVFVAMELVRGPTLRAWLRAASRPWREVVGHFLQAGRGLRAAHDQGLVHRDFKPDNVLVRDLDGRVVVTDFGLAIPSPDAVTGSVSRDELAAGGTPGYMAPEQHGARDVDARTDVFSFCVALYEGLYGQRPFAKSEDETWPAAIARGPRPPPAGRAVPVALRRIVVRGLAADPADRWPAMDPLIAALERVVGRRRRTALALAALAALAAPIAVFIGQRGDVADPCALDAARVERVWNPARRDRIRAAMTASGKVYAASAAERATASLDAWAARWRDVRASACRDGDDPGARTRAACLDDQLVAADARATLLETAEADLLPRAPTIAAMLGPGSCAGAGRDPAMPSDPLAQAKIQAGWAGIARLEALFAAGRYREAHDATPSIMARAEAVGWPRLVDAAHLVAARIDLQLDAIDDARRLDRAVAESAAARGDEASASRAWLDLVVAGYYLHDVNSLDVVATAARAAAHRAGTPAAEANAETRIAAALADADRLDEADVACRRAQEIVVQHPEIPADDAYDVVGCQIIVADRRGRMSDTLAASRARLAAHLRALGPRNPMLGDDLRNMALALNHLDRHDDAAVLAWTAYQLLVDGYGRRDRATIDAGIDLSFAMMSSPRPEDRARALALADGYRADADAAYGATSAPAIDVHAAHAQVRATVGEVADGLAEYAATWAEITSNDQVSLPTRVSLGNNYAQLLRQQGRCADALPVLATLLARTDLPANSRAPLVFQHAGCLIDPKFPKESAQAVAELEPVIKTLRLEDVGPSMLGNFERLDAMGLVDAGHPAQARPHLERALAIFRDAHLDAFTTLAEKELAALGPR